MQLKVTTVIGIELRATASKCIVLFACVTISIKFDIFVMRCLWNWQISWCKYSYTFCINTENKGLDFGNETEWQRKPFFSLQENISFSDFLSSDFGKKKVWNRKKFYWQSFEICRLVLKNLHFDAISFLTQNV